MPQPKKATKRTAKAKPRRTAKTEAIWRRFQAGEIGFDEYRDLMEQARAKR